MHSPDDDCPFCCNNPDHCNCGAVERPEMLACERCDAEVDPSDKYAVTTDPWGGNREIVCESCRERAYDAYQASAFDGAAAPSLIEQQREAWRLK